MQECNLWWRGKHSTAWLKQEILIVRPARTPQFHQDIKSLVFSGQTWWLERQEENVWCHPGSSQCPVWQYTSRPLYAGNLHWLKPSRLASIKNEEWRILNEMMCSLSLPPSCSGRHPNSPGHRSSSPVSLSSTVWGFTPLYTSLHISTLLYTSRGQGYHLTALHSSDQTR